VTEGGSLKQGFTDLKTLVPQRVEINIPDHEVAAQQRRIDALPPREMCDLLDKFF
jgi:hypothetical protein